MDLFFQLFVHLCRRFPTYNWWLLWQNSLFWTVFELEEIICLKFINIHLERSNSLPARETMDQAVSTQSGSLHKMLMFVQTPVQWKSETHCYSSTLWLQMKLQPLRLKDIRKIFSKEFSQVHLEPFQIKPGDVIKLNSISVASSPLIPPTGKLNIFQCYRAQWGFFVLL